MQQCLRLPDRISLPDNSSYGLLFDEMDNLWVSSNKGLLKIVNNNLNPTRYGPEDGLQGEKFSPGVCFKSKNGEMYFGGVSGFNHFMPEEFAETPFIHQVFVTSYKLAGHAEQTALFYKPSKIKVNKKDLPLVLRLSNCNFSSPQKMNLKVRILEDNNREIVVDEQMSVQLTNLSPGKNSLELHTDNPDQDLNGQNVLMTIILAIPVWQSQWFRFSLVILFTFVFIFWYQIRQKSRQQKSLIEIQGDLTPLLRRRKITKRESEILLSVLEGKTNKDIENDLFISYKTVKAHLYNLYQKMEVNNRLQLMNAVQEYLRKANLKNNQNRLNHPH
jgi:DNA-binding CsgD family transcriptional regulator